VNSNNEESQSSRVLAKAEARILATVADRIFPATDTPGAREAGALDYIDIALAGAYARSLPLYRRGLRALDRHARGKFGAKLTLLEPERQDLVLADFEAGKVSDFKKAAEFRCATAGARGHFMRFCF
jgi:hypothetical protein